MKLAPKTTLAEVGMPYKTTAQHCEAQQHAELNTKISTPQPPPPPPPHPVHTTLRLHSGTFLVEGPGKSRKKYPIKVISFFVSDEVPSAAMPPQALQLEPRRVSIE